MGHEAAFKCDLLDLAGNLKSLAQYYDVVTVILSHVTAALA